MGKERENSVSNYKLFKGSFYMKAFMYFNHETDNGIIIRLSFHFKYLL